MYLLTTSGFPQHLHVMVVGDPLDSSLALVVKLADVSGGVHLRGDTLGENICIKPYRNFYRIGINPSV